MSGSSLLENAYHVLGLRADASQKDIVKRSKEISNRLKIDDVPAYELDLVDSTQFRTSASLKRSVEALSSPRGKLQQSFFWFQTFGDADEKALSEIENKNYEQAIKFWTPTESDSEGTAILKKKNLATLLIYLFFKDARSSKPEEVLGLWHDVIDSKQFWKSFHKSYLLSDDLETDESLIEELRKTSPKIIIDTFAELAHRHNQDSFIAECSKIFGSSARGLEKNVLNPIFQAIVESVEKLEAMKVSADGVLDENEKKDLKSYISQIKGRLTELKSKGLYDDSQSKAVRDRAATAIRSVAVDIHNNLEEHEICLSLHRDAIEVAGTDSLKQQLNQELEYIKAQQAEAGYVKPVHELIKVKKYKEALDRIREDRPKYPDRDALQKYYGELEILCIRLLAEELYEQGKAKVDAKKFDQAGSIFANLNNYLRSHIDLFAMKKQVLFETLDDFKNIINKAELGQFDQIDKIRADYIKSVSGVFGDRHESHIFVMLLDSVMWTTFAERFPKLKSQAQTKNALNSLIGYGVVFGVIILWAAISDSCNGSKSHASRSSYSASSSGSTVQQAVWNQASQNEFEQGCEKTTLEGVKDPEVRYSERAKLFVSNYCNCITQNIVSARVPPTQAGISSYLETSYGKQLMKTCSDNALPSGQ